MIFQNYSVTSKFPETLHSWSRAAKSKQHGVNKCLINQHELYRQWRREGRPFPALKYITDIQAWAVTC